MYASASIVVSEFINFVILLESSRAEFCFYY